MSAHAGLPLAAAAAAIPAVSVAGPSPDEGLISLCDEMTALHRQIEESYPIGGTLDAEEQYLEQVEPLNERIEALADQIAAMTATTPEGHIARARAAAVRFSDTLESPHDIFAKLVGPLVRDMAAGGAA